MKRIIPLLIVSFLVLGTIVLWFSQPMGGLPLVELVQLGVILLLVLFGLYMAMARWRAHHRGEPADDEMSRRIVQRAAAVSFYASLYLWVAMIYIKDRVQLDTEVLLGCGILGMGVIWVVMVLFFRFKGLKDA